MSNQIALSQPAELVRQSTDVAGLCREIVLKTSLEIQGRKFIRCEGYMAIATAHGCLASSGPVERVEGGYRAMGEIRRMSDGNLLASAEGFVGEDEPTWFGGEIQTRNGIKTLPKRPDYAIRAMCSTRAISRACRSAFAHVVVLMDAGLSTTPAEEVPQGGFQDDPHTDPKGDERITDDAVPQKYWQMKANNGTEEANKWLAAKYGASHAVARKVGKDWRVVLFGEAPVNGPESATSHAEYENAVEAETVDSPGEYRITWGKNRGLMVSELTPAQRHWYHEYLEGRCEQKPREPDSPENKALLAALIAYKAAQSPQEPRQGTKPAPAGSTPQAGDWKAVKVHIGHPAKGATLGEINRAQLDELRAKMEEKAKLGTRNLSAADKKLIAALAMELGERKPAADPDDEIPMFNGPNHQKLHDALVFAEISEEDFMATAREQKWIPEKAQDFLQMSDETAKRFSEDFENVTDAVRIYLDKRNASNA